jgi:hypothetical protein
LPVTIDPIEKNNIPKYHLPPPFQVLDINQMLEINITNLPATLETIYNERKYTPLILDQSDRTTTFYNYQDAIIIDAKMYLSKVAILKTMSKDECKEDLRRQLVNALKYGKTLVLHFGNSAFNFDPYWYYLYRSQLIGMILLSQRIFS